MPPRMIEVEAHGRDVPGEGDGLRFGLRFADGTEVAQDDETGLRGGIGPILFRFESSTSSGPEPSVDIVMRLWAWPLPPPGRVALTCS
ncbi:hypothetical protein SAMN05444920_11128 [Nonomuraea solani]|uniref:Uncharacterized protein n=2 Tax=Nonomuraea solani TaxID=1144553 RepID=A0A1H6EIK6_9ACTN|nr:hypothetical protein SAMN05444920_11128 [Nonomuraea solani]